MRASREDLLDEITHRDGAATLVLKLPLRFRDVLGQLCSPTVTQTALDQLHELDLVPQGQFIRLFQDLTKTGFRSHIALRNSIIQHRSGNEA
jgi:hypothetical protein